jgi:hypothetical protein
MISLSTPLFSHWSIPLKVVCNENQEQNSEDGYIEYWIRKIVLTSHASTAPLQFCLNGKNPQISTTAKANNHMRTTDTVHLKVRGHIEQSNHIGHRLFHFMEK